MDQVKEAFQKVKEDIYDIKKELSEIQTSILELTKKLDNLSNQKTNYIDLTKYSFIKNFEDKPTDRQTNRQTNQQTDNFQNYQTDNQTQNSLNSTFRQVTSTESNPSTDNSTQKYGFEGFKPLNLNISTGNEGVSTDRQTNQQTDTSTGNEGVRQIIRQSNTYEFTSPKHQNTSLILDQLDEIKRSLRLKIKKLTNQEMLVLSTIYQFEDEGLIIDYEFLSQKLNLSESSIRDYIQRIINKNIPLTKEKLNNKKVILHISQELRRLASLNTLLSLRNL